MTEETQNKWRNFGSKIKDALPMLLPFFMGPAGAPIGAGAKVLLDVFGTDDPEAIDEQIANMTPDQRLALEQEVTQRIQIESMERQAAWDAATRRLESDNATDSPFVKLNRPLNCWYYNLLTLAVIVYGFVWMDPSQQGIYDTTTDFLRVILIGILGFYFFPRSAEKMMAIWANRRPHFKGIIPAIQDKLRTTPISR